MLTRPVHMVMGVDEPFEGALESTCRQFCDRTREYWMDWVRRLAFSIDWQDEIIRAGITLKLCNFEETGAIVAALTTSIPEGPGSGRNWDYRYCWMRDAFFVVRALNRIGATRTMEDFISYILSIAAGRADRLKPLYGVVHTEPLEERAAEALAGFNGDGPVRIGNAAADQNQHDVYGSIIMAATPMFFDRRLPNPGDAALFRVIEPLGEQAARLALEPDAGIWEYRGRKRVHTYSAAMCWAGCQRLEAIAAHLGLPERAAYWGDVAKRIGEEVLSARLESQAQGLFGGVRQRRSRRQLPAVGRTRADRTRRSALRLHRGGDRARTSARLSRYALCCRRRFRPAGDGFFDLPILADRCIVGHWAA